MSSHGNFVYAPSGTTIWLEYYHSAKYARSIQLHLQARKSSTELKEEFFMTTSKWWNLTCHHDGSISVCYADGTPLSIASTKTA